MTGRARWQLGWASAGVLLGAADTYVVVVALPAIMNGVGIGLDQIQRATPAISGYLLGYVAVLPLLGRLSDLSGRAPVLVGCLIAFAAGSAITAGAHSLPLLVAGRGLQGLGGGGMVPVTLALVADRWPPEKRGIPLGVVGAVQELGAVLGPLYGAVVVAVAGWRWIFWINLPLAALLALAFRRSSPRQPAGGREARRVDWVGVIFLVLGAIAALGALAAPHFLASDPTIGRLYGPLAHGPTWGTLTTPIALAAIGLLGCFVAREALAPAAVRPLLPLRRVGPVLRRADLLGAAFLGGVLACVVVAFSTTNPSRQVVASSAPVLALVAAVCLVGLAFDQRRSSHPLLERAALARRGAWGALVVNLAVGAALMAALVDVPLFARDTRYPNSQLGAALELLRFLVAVPVGAILGGVLSRHRQAGPYVAALGMALSTGAFFAMTGWSANAMSADWHVAGVQLPFAAADAELVLAGLGFGLAIAPVNASILGSVPERLHGLASSLAVVARTVGMLAGISALTAIALHGFYRAEARIGSPLTLCPRHPGNCPAYTSATNHALLSELHSIFMGAGVCGGAAVILAFALLRPGVGAGPGAGPALASGSAVGPGVGSGQGAGPGAGPGPGGGRTPLAPS